MNYKQAKKIQGIVFDLDAMNEISTVVCAVQLHNTTDDWEVCIFAREPDTRWQNRAERIAMAIFGMVDALAIQNDNYNAGTTQEKWVSAMRMW
jgi:hypothetical protein